MTHVVQLVEEICRQLMDILLAVAAQRAVAKPVEHIEKVRRIVRGKALELHGPEQALQLAHKFGADTGRERR